MDHIDNNPHGIRLRAEQQRDTVNVWMYILAENLL